MSLDTLRSIYKGEMTAMTAGGKGSGTDSAPLEFEFTEAAMELDDPKQAAFHFLRHFFNRSKPEKVLLGEEHSRVVHGANVVALYYAPGFRSAWYMVKKGQRLNEPGDTNPFSQAFVIISGKGLSKIGEDTIEIRAGESYYVPPGSDHVIWTEDEEPLVLIWFGWGEGA
jgi:mannose-6-phosphate isomerase-like protein (cupin superfamily)